ncbi:hypothetical protein M5E06_29480 [Azospirillum sp. A1-3]|uniref:hypothetical protein n=1 Tax=Azospirillum sp. A1-3 TaxID=185874 RepID=UPI0020773874|nr:hypothetical protein [Azospirillum sp. A1-3]MCM8738263.1 hypothetical protein [Azospirillum sp. A1-3]
MKIAETIVLINKGPFAKSKQWADIRHKIHTAIAQAEWPVNSGSFTIYPESGKRSGQGNGVVPIKAKPMKILRDDGWTLEYPWEVAAKAGVAGKSRKGSSPGDIDAAKQFDDGLVVVEWETGNVSSSHRAINKMALGLQKKKCVAGVLVIPNMTLAKFLTDRIGNIEEIRPYFSLWENLAVNEGVLEVVVIEQDSVSMEVPRIPKGRDGRAAEGQLAALIKKS